METLKSIENRRSIRNYTEEKVSVDIVKDILNCGRLAPSAKNRQPWYFVVAQNEIKDKIADMMIDYSTNADDTIESARIGHKSSVSPTANIIKQAPILILVFREKNDNWIIGDNLSIGACVQNMCLRATDLGLGTLWIRDIVYVSEDVAEMLGHSDLELNCAVSLGYPNQSPKMRPRKNLEDIMEWV